MDSHLPEYRRLASLFPNGPTISDDQLDIIVSDGEVMELMDGFGDPDDAYKRKIKKAHGNLLKHFPPAGSPSELVCSSHKLADLLGSETTPIHLGRPGEVPVAIFNPALTSLQWHLNNLEDVQVFRSEVERAAKYLRCAVAFYRDETLRQNAMKELVDEAIGEKGEWGCTLSWADNIKPGSSWWYGIFLLLALELKNTLGLSGDALLQAVFDYSKIISRDKYKPFQGFCNFPIVLVGATANRLEISVAVCGVGPIYMTKLLTLDLSLGFHASDNIICLARVFKALLRYRLDLHNYYDSVNDLSLPRLSCLFPNPTLVDRSKKLPTLTYRNFLSRAGRPTSALVDLGNRVSSMYIATLSDNNKEVVVKFTARYNEVAHRLLADVDLAPELHFCERVIGDLYMVIMDRVDGMSVWQLQEEKKPVPAIVLKNIEKAVDILHEEDIVFGNLRDPNILYLPSKDCAMLVDFDWCGKDGVDRYPATLNPGIAWAEDVSPYGVMVKAHDTWQLNRLAAVCEGAP